jgi:hypothetical protein
VSYYLPKRGKEMMTMSNAQAFNEALTVLGNGLRHEIDKVRFLAAAVTGTTELDHLMPLAPKGAVLNGLRGILEGVAEAYDRAYSEIAEKMEKAREGEVEA